MKATSFTLAEPELSAYLAGQAWQSKKIRSLIRENSYVERKGDWYSVPAYLLEDKHYDEIGNPKFLTSLDL